VSLGDASIRERLGAEDARLSRRLRRWTLLPAATGIAVVTLAMLSSTYATRRVLEATSRLESVNSRLRVATESLATLDREIAEKQRQQLALQQVIGRVTTSVARTNEAVAREALEQAVASTPGAAAIVPVVYIHFRGTVARSVLEGLRSELNRAGYSAPGTERIDRSFNSGTYYFHSRDSVLASGLAARAEAFLRERGCPVALPLRYASRYASTAKPRQIEVWVNTNCPGVR
jgi:hypothetical protein